MDEKKSFLNREPDEEFYMDLPIGLNVQNREDEIYKLIKYLYGLKQSPRA